MIGKVVSHYQILEKLGGGGMGVVYKANDLKLDRLVALKFLPPEFARDQDARQRFIHEAKAASSLQHNNICAIHDIEESGDGQMFMVMDYYEGETLEQRISRGALRVDQAVDIAAEAARGLAAAHAHGIIHRDVKPANVILTTDGVVKVVDFGLARAAHLSMITRTGSTLGTVAYMSPEQVRGDRVDSRTDVWSLGVVLYEMLTGQLPFRGEHDVAVLYSIANEEPRPLREFRDDLPKAIEEIVLRALKKDPNQRFPAMEDMLAWLLRRDLPGSQGAHLTNPAEEHSTASWKWRIHLGRALLFGIALLSVGGIVTWLLSRHSSDRVLKPLRSYLELPQGLHLPTWALAPARTEIALSPDGTKLVFSAVNDSTVALYVLDLASGQTEQIKGTRGGEEPFFSPEGQWIGFQTRDELKKVALEGSPPISLCGGIDRIDPMGFAWARDGTIYMGSLRGGLWALRPGREQLDSVTSLEIGGKEATHRLPHLLPDGRGVLFTVSPFINGLKSRVDYLDLGSGQRTALVDDAADCRYVPTGHVIFVRRGTLMAAPFDLETHRLRGVPVLLESDVQQATSITTGANSFAGQYTFSESGLLAFANGGMTPDMLRSLIWIDHRGRAKDIDTTRVPLWAPRLSPDESRVAYVTMGTLGQTWDLWVRNIHSRTVTRLVTGGEVIPSVVWSPDGRLIFFHFKTDTTSGVYAVAPEGAQEPEMILRDTLQGYCTPYSISPDGNSLLLGWDGDLFVFRLTDRTLRPFLIGEGVSHVEFSPNAKWVAFSSRKSGRMEVYCVDYPEKKHRVVISSGGGFASMWDPTGGRIFYQRGFRTILEVQFPGEGGPMQAPARVLTDLGADYSGYPMRFLDISRNGKAFLATRDYVPPPLAVRRINLVANWFEEVKGRVSDSEN